MVIILFNFYRERKAKEKEKGRERSREERRKVTCMYPGVLVVIHAN